MKIQVHILLCLMLEYVSTQFTSTGRHPKTPCEVRGTALVEQFFNIVFAEFHRSPPACICVQMCPDQPTYCYPNGCFKKEKKRETPVSRIQHEGAKTLFLVDNDKDFLIDVTGSGNSAAPSVTGKPERPLNYYPIGRPSPFKEIVFKYKRLPKLEMKYNLREQVKNTKEKRAEVDVSKTRWPTNKQLNRMPYKINHQRNSNYLTFSETNQVETPKYFKRYLTKRENQNGSDIGALYLYKDASNFSLETLIDNLIERGLEGVNSTLGLKISKSGELKDEDNKGDDKFMNSVTEVVTEDTTRGVNIVKADQNKSNDKAVVNSTAAYFEMMTTLSKEIKKQNIASIKTVEQLTGRKYEENLEINISNIFNLTAINTTRTNHVAESSKTVIIGEETIESTTNKVPKILHKEVTPHKNGQVKKSKQRIVRKLRNRKLN
ncbi:uncharacterized protein [Epargyreus clarus]|uniref:uncharacterized protein n=1 Tax=Epargyreus clarus TaxID=520877 RepID=UPI003C2FD13D